MELSAAFLDDGKVICNSFFTSTDATERTWSDLERLISSDDVTFWTVITHHKSLVSVLSTLMTTVDNARNNVIAMKRSKTEDEHHFTKHDEENLTSFFMRVATSTDVCYDRHVNVCSLATRLDSLFSWKLLCPLCIILLRQHSGAAASLTVTSLCILNPQLMDKFAAFMTTWCDTIDKLCNRVLSELRRGRFQRLPGDVMSLFEQLFRHTRYLWAVIQCAPFLSNYIPLFRILRALRLVVDFAFPVLQHFALVSDAIHPRRALLSRATSLIVNAAINSALVIMLFRSFATVDSGANDIDDHVDYNHRVNAKEKDRLFCLPTRVQNTYDALTSFMLSYCHGYPRLLLTNAEMGEIQMLLEQLAPTNYTSDTSDRNYNKSNKNNNKREERGESRTDHDDRYLGVVLLFLLNELTDGKDYAGVLQHGKPRFAILLLKELVHQGVHIDSLIFDHLITLSEAQKLGASQELLSQFTEQHDSDSLLTKENEKNSSNTHNREKNINQTTFTGSKEVDEKTRQPSDALSVSGKSNANAHEQKTPNRESLVEHKPHSLSSPTSTSISISTTPLEPEVSMVKDVFPHFTVNGIRTALSFYNHDVEQFILDASMDNLPPHLAPTLISNDDAIAAALAEPAREAGTTTTTLPHDINNNTDNTKNAGATNAKNSLAELHLDLFSLSSSSSTKEEMIDSDYDSTLLAQDLFEYLSGMARSEPQSTGTVKNTNTDNNNVDQNKSFNDNEKDVNGNSDEFNFDFALDDEDEMDELINDKIDKQEYHTRWGTNAYEGTFDDALTMNTHSSGFEVDDEMRERIRVLNELMYEDEFDDTALDEVHLAGASDGDSDEEEQKTTTQPAFNLNINANNFYKNTTTNGSNDQYTNQPMWTTNNAENNTASSTNTTNMPFHPTPHDAYHDKRYHEQRARARAQKTKEMRSNRTKTSFMKDTNAEDNSNTATSSSGKGAVPAYAHKQKTVRRGHNSNTGADRDRKTKGGGKNAIAQALKKGRTTM